MNKDCVFLSFSNSPREFSVGKLGKQRTALRQFPLAPASRRSLTTNFRQFLRIVARGEQISARSSVLSSAENKFPPVSASRRSRGKNFRKFLCSVVRGEGISAGSSALLDTGSEFPLAPAFRTKHLLVFVVFAKQTSRMTHSCLLNLYFSLAVRCSARKNEYSRSAFKHKKDAQCDISSTFHVLLCENRPFPKKPRSLYPPPYV